MLYILYMYQKKKKNTYKKFYQTKFYNLEIIYFFHLNIWPGVWPLQWHYWHREYFMQCERAHGRLCHMICHMSHDLGHCPYSPFLGSQNLNVAKIGIDFSNIIPLKVFTKLELPLKDPGPKWEIPCMYKRSQYRNSFGHIPLPSFFKILYLIFHAYLFPECYFLQVCWDGHRLLFRPTGN